MTEKDYSSGSLQLVAISLHEMYLSLQEAGFKKKEALYLVARMLSAGVREGDE